MAVQIIDPVEDTFIGSWDNELQAGSDIYTSLLDGDTVTDEAWIISPHQPSSEIYVAKLTDFINPVISVDPWKIKFRAQKMNDTGVSLDLTVQLRQYYVNEGDQGDLIYEELFEDVAFGFQDYEIELTPLVDFDPATLNTTQLYVRLIADLP